MEFPLQHHKADTFDAKKTFRLAILCVRCMVRLQRLKRTPEAFSIAIAGSDPYRIKSFRKAIDNCAFRVYGHWVKKSDCQNRAALFENTPKVDLRNLYVKNLNRI